MIVFLAYLIPFLLSVACVALFSPRAAAVFVDFQRVPAPRSVFGIGFQSLPLPRKLARLIRRIFSPGAIYGAVSVAIALASHGLDVFIRLRIKLACSGAAFHVGLIRRIAMISRGITALFIIAKIWFVSISFMESMAAALLYLRRSVIGALTVLTPGKQAVTPFRILAEQINALVLIALATRFHGETFRVSIARQQYYSIGMRINAS